MTMEALNTSVTINGGEYAVGLRPGPERDEGRPAYRITGARGAAYRTVRNRHNPEIMFLLREGKFGPGAMYGVWLTDRGGELRQVRGL